MSIQPLPADADFDSILDHCLSQMQAGRLALEECLALYPDQATALQPLLAAAARPMAAPRLSLRPAAREAIEQRLIARLLARRASRSSASRPLAVHRVSFAAAMLAAVLFGVLITAASPGSLPGDALYPIKRLSESIGLQLAGEPARAQLRIEWAQRRLDEFRQLASRGEVRIALLEEFQIETNAALASSDGLGEEERNALLGRVAAAYTRAVELTSDVRDRVPAAALSDFDELAAALAEEREDVNDRAPAPVPALTPTSTFTPRPPAPTFTPTPTPALRGSDPTNEPSRTPPGRGTPGGGAKKTRDAGDSPGGGPPETPPGQGAPGGPSGTPPGRGGNQPAHTPEPAHTEKPSRTPKP